MKQALFNEAEILEPGDLSAIGAHMREGVQNIAGGAVGYPRHWARLTVSASSPVTLRVEPGQYWMGDTIYDLDAAATIDLQPLAPLAANDRKWIAILARGESAVLTQSRLFETDADTGETVIVATPKTDVRRLVFVTQAGADGPTPIRPTLPSNECCVAWVLLGATGVVSIEMHQADRVKTLYEVEGRVTALESSVRDTTARTTTLQTDLAGVASRLQEAPRPELFAQVMRDVAALRVTNLVPDEARGYRYNPGLTPDDWDRQNANWLARIDEGVRFQAAAERDVQLALFDPANPALRTYFYDNNQRALLMPAWREVTRMAVEGNDGSINISQLTHTVVTAHLREIARKRTTYGPSFTVCTNAREWGAYAAGRQIGERFSRPGENFDYEVQGAAGKWYTLRQLRVEEYIDTYWEYVSNEVGLNGSIYGQSWLQAQAGVLTSVELYFTRVAAVGDVHLLLVECGPTAAPDPSKAIQQVVIPAGQLALGWTKFSMRPSLLEAGKRYAWLTVTTGNHALAFVADNRFAQGSMFQFTDGAYAQGSLERDFAMRLNFAQFASPRAEIEFAPLTLENGMSEVELLHAGWSPGTTSIEWEIRPTGSAEWVPISRGDPAALMGLPALTRLRAVFVGTTDLHAAIVLDATARATTRRLRNDLRAVMTQKPFGFSTQTVRTHTSLDAFDPTQDTFTPSLVLPGGATVAASATTMVSDPERPGRYFVTATFALPAPIAGAAYRGDMVTQKVIPQAFLQDVMLVAM